MDVMSTVPDYTEFQAPAQQQQDGTLFVKFDIRPKEDRRASAKAGRPIYKDVEYVDIRVPGSRDAVVRPATAADRERFPRHYAAFQKRVELPEEGTALSMWPPISRGMAETLAYMNIKTVENLAAAPDNLISQVMGGMGFKTLAADFLKAAAADAPLTQMREELAQRDKQIEGLEAKLKRLMEKLEPDLGSGLDEEPQEAQQPPAVLQGYASVLSEPEASETPVEPEEAPQAPRRRRRG